MASRMRPVHEIKLGCIQAAIWRNTMVGRAAWFNVSISRLYRDGEQWKTTSSMRRDDLPLVSKAAEMAYAWIWENGESSGGQYDELS
jgi:hypothetical protein